jgi:sugar phosphate isomerase/epimerase
MGDAMPTFPPIALQLLTLHQAYDVETDAAGMLAAAARAGYTAVEGQSRSNPAGFAAALAAQGLAHAGLHIGGGQTRDVAALRTLAAHTGTKDLCISGLLDWNRRTPADWHESIAVFNACGRALRADGLHVHYHNHDFEFARIEGLDLTGMELLARELDPAAVDFCVDVAWVLRGGADPAAFLREHADRIGYLHLKDWNGTAWTPVGQGLVPWASTLDALATLPAVRWAVVEQDTVDGDPEAAATASRAFLRARGL